MATHSSILGESHGQRSLVGYGPQGHKESDTTEATQHKMMYLSPSICFQSICIFLFKVDFLGFPGGSVVVEGTSQRRRRRFCSCSGRILRAPEQLGLSATTLEPVIQSPRTATTEPTAAEACTLWSLWPSVGQATTVRSLHTTAVGQPCSL